LQSFSALIEQDIFSRLTIRQMIEQRTSYGGTGSKMVAGAIATAEKWLDQKKDHLPGGNK
jgi:argininosuccinate lyase